MSITLTSHNDVTRSTSGRWASHGDEAQPVVGTAVDRPAVDRVQRWGSGPDGLGCQSRDGEGTSTCLGYDHPGNINSFDVAARWRGGSGRLGVTRKQSIVNDIDAINVKKINQNKLNLEICIIVCL